MNTYTHKDKRHAGRARAGSLAQTKLNQTNMNTYTHKDKRGGWGGWVAWRPIPPLGVFVHASDFVGKLRREDSGLVRGVGVASVGAVAAALAVVAILVVVRFWARASRRSLRRGSSRRPRCSRKTTTSCPKPR